MPPQVGVIKTQKLGRRTSWSRKAEFEGGDFAWQMVTIRLCAEDPPDRLCSSDTQGGAHSPGSQTSSTSPWSLQD